MVCAEIHPVTLIFNHKLIFMRRSYLLVALASVILAGCTKTTNNTTIIPQPPSFLVNGVTDLTLQNGSFEPVFMQLTVQYSDSAQQAVTLSLSALPASITMDSSSWTATGIPTFSTTLSLRDSTAAGAVPGKYPMVLTATTASGEVKTYGFNLTVKAQPPCTSFFVGAYHLCNSDCSTSGYYTDSIYNDPTVINKVWFNNFNNTHSKVYGLYNCSNEQLTIPPQTIGAETYSGSATIFSHNFSMFISSSTSSCDINMQ